MNPNAPLVISSGDPAGIGPDLVLALPEALPNARYVILGDMDVLNERATMLGYTCQLQPWQPGQPVPDQGVPVWHCPAGAPIKVGEPNPASAAGTLTMLNRAIDGCLDGTFSAMVTAPLAKSVICDGAEPNFTGHTEYLAARSNTKQVVMMLATGDLRVALATTHLPLRDVADAITHETLSTTISILHNDLKQRFHVAQPRILVLGLNPHAGEDGHLGMEEINVITPTLNSLRAQGYQLTGPLPADTAFTPQLLATHDAVLAMYHDQGLPVLKYAGFGKAVNITLGLPFLRTSVDHGTAFALAGTGEAKVGSLVAATQLAQQLVQGHPES